MIDRRRWKSWSLLTTLLLCWTTPSIAEEKIINITGNGTDAQYVEQGKAKQLNVLVRVGDTVRWKNNGDRTHTATSDLTAQAGGFTTGDITAGQQSQPIEINQALYDAVRRATGGAAGERVHLGYYCVKHPTLMGGKLVIEPREFKEKRQDKNDHN